MSLRSVTSLVPSPKSGRAKWPISRVLALFYTLSASAILFVASAIQYYLMARGAEAEDRQSLADQVETLRLTLRATPDDPEALRREVQSEGAARRFAKYYARILTPEGKVVIQTEDMDRLAPSNAFPPAADVLKSPMTTEEIGQYNLKYVGRQKVDDIDCYVFDVEPKIIEKKHRYFDGRIWVDATDLQIVVTDGRMVPDDTRKGSEDLHPPFMTWRQQVDGHYWFPVYTKGEGILHFSGGSGYMAQDVHIRDTVKYTDYKRFGSTSTIIYEGQNITPPAKQPEPAQPKK